MTAVTHRRDAYWHDLMVGHSHWVGSLNHEGHVYETVKRVVPTLRQVYVPMSGTGHFHVYMRIEKNYDGLGKSALVAALGPFHTVGSPAGLTLRAPATWNTVDTPGPWDSALRGPSGAAP